MMAAIPNDLLEALVASSDHSLIKIEMAGGIPTWEAMPGVRHQRILRAVANSVRRASSGGDGGCHVYEDVYVRFPDGSFKSPDVGIYGAQLPDVDGATQVLPVAVIEIVSQGYEAKDEIGLPFYLSQGIADVVVYDPRSRKVIHATRSGEKTLEAPVVLNLSCGCAVTISFVSPEHPDAEGAPGIARRPGRVDATARVCERKKSGRGAFRTLSPRERGSAEGCSEGAPQVDG